MKHIASPRAGQQHHEQGILHLNARGFTLIELMIGVAVVAILMSTALPAYQGAVRKARRADAMLTLGQVQMAQERWFSDHMTYSDSLADIGVKLGTGGKTSGGHYAVTLENVSASGYAVVATAQGGQGGDAQCRVLRLMSSNGATVYSSIDARGTENKEAHNRCWMR